MESPSANMLLWWSWQKSVETSVIFLSVYCQLLPPGVTTAACTSPCPLSPTFIPTLSRNSPCAVCRGFHPPTLWNHKLSLPVKKAAGLYTGLSSAEESAGKALVWSRTPTSGVGAQWVTHHTLPGCSVPKNKNRKTEVYLYKMFTYIFIYLCKIYTYIYIYIIHKNIQLCINIYTYMLYICVCVYVNAVHRYYRD